MTIPRWAQALIRMIATPDRAEDAIGDLNEAHARRMREGSALKVWLQTAFAVMDMAASLARPRLSRFLALGFGLAEGSANRSTLGRRSAALGRDLALACRNLVRARGFTAATVLTLSVAIGANTAVFSVIDSVLLEPLDFPDADHLVTIRGSAPGLGLPDEFDPVVEFYVQYREEASLLDDLGIYRTGQTTVRAGDHLERLFGAQATYDLFRTLDATPQLGRFPTVEDAGRTVVISDWLWRDWFGSDSGVLGTSLEVAGEPREIVGVAAPSFRLPDSRTAFWLDHHIGDPSTIRPGASGGFRFVARVRPEAELDDVAAQLTTLAARIPDRFGGPPRYLEIIDHHRAIVRPLAEDLVGQVAGPLWLVFGAVGIALLVACANVANLFAVRSAGRHRNLAVRRALGAGSGDLVRLLVAEAAVLAALGGAAGVLLARAGLPMLVALAPEDVPNLDAAALDGSALAFAAGISALTVLVFSAFPAVRASRPSAAGVLTASSAGGGPSARYLLVLLQTASALVLLIGSSLLARSLWTLSRVDAGYETEGIVSFQIAPDRTELVDGPDFAAFHREFMGRVATLPGVESVGLSDRIPLDGGAAGGRFYTEPSLAAGEEPQAMRFTYVGGDYFRTMGIGLVDGLLPTESDPSDGGTPVVVSRTAAQRLWMGEEPLGRRLSRSAEPTAWMTVVGVVEDVLLDDFRQVEPDPVVYLPLSGPEPQSWRVRSPAYVVKSSRAATLMPEIRALVRQFVPESPVYRVALMRDLANRSMAWLSFTMLILGAASLVALVLGTVGLYAVLASVVAARSREIAVRMALGAQAGRVRNMVVGQGIRVTAAGIMIGLVLSGVAARVLESLLFGVQGRDPATYIAMALLMLVVAALASYVPSKRASSVDPMNILRSD